MKKLVCAVRVVLQGHTGRCVWRRTAHTGVRWVSADFEASFLRLIDKLTNGSKIVINETGTSLRYKPGFISGGAIEHDCASSRSIGWYIEGILQLAPFAKKPIRAVFHGVTNDNTDFGVDTLRTVTLPLLKVGGRELVRYLRAARC